MLASLAPDGRTLLLTLQDGSRRASSIGGDAPRPVSALAPADRLVAWSSDSRAVYVQRGLDVPAILDRVDLATGTRTMVRQLTPPGGDAVATMYVIDWVDDGGWFAYNYRSLTSTLFVVTGAID